ncbi:hypothetical protein EW146_g1260 [Bondarzewia mesenterica]|uniref:Protein kinase domain-containing protein n=1 Tax=Bondarzewia mesenterica TaxID=1095465 RepID=A0A4S4M5T9_9AGAM|nr:hypothetical protein EW146_g1260 [Bondarzewia mesenterica]
MSHVFYEQPELRSDLSDQTGIPLLCPVIESCVKSMHIGSNGSTSIFLRKGFLNDQPITYISKVWQDEDRDEFLKEMRLYTDANLLLPLQGTCVPYLIDADMTGDCLSIAMEPPHAIRWRAADAFISSKDKASILTAYRRLHGQGVLHGSPSFQNMLIGDDRKVTIVNFVNARCSRASDARVGIPRCEKCEFAYEMRRVKFLLDYHGAREAEFNLTKVALQTGRMKSFTSSKLKPRDHFFIPMNDLQSWYTEMCLSYEGPMAQFKVPRSFREHPSHSYRVGSPRTFSSTAALSVLDQVNDDLEGYLELKAQSTRLQQACTQDVTPPSTTPSITSSHLRKRRRSDLEHDGDDSAFGGPARKRRKLEIRKVRFAPDVVDNSIWATGRGYLADREHAAHVSFMQGVGLLGPNLYPEPSLADSSIALNPSSLESFVSYSADRPHSTTETTNEGVTKGSSDENGASEESTLDEFDDDDFDEDPDEDLEIPRRMLLN